MELLNKNSGATSFVFKKNDNEVRIFTRDNMKYEWLIHGLKIADFVDMIESNKHPKLSSFPIYIIDMPFLYPLSTENKKKINKALKECKDLFNHKGQRTLEPVCPASAEAANAQVALVALERQNFGAERKPVVLVRRQRSVAGETDAGDGILFSVL